MSLLRNFSPGGSEPDDDEPPTTAAQQDEDERPAAAEPGETAPSGGGHAPGAARYAFAGPAASAAPPPSAVVPSEVVTEPADLAPGDPAPATVPVPVTEADDPETTPPDREIPVARDTPRPVFVPSGREAAAPVTAPEFAAPLLGDATELRARWQRVQGDFVDDPQAAVSDAADLVGQTAEALMAALRQRQQQLRTAWQRGPANGQAPAAAAPGAMDTEHLRLMMQRYRALFNQLCRPS
jgi:hypothetical protein